MLAIGSYFRTLSARFGTAWTRFWFVPSDPLTLGVIRILTAGAALGLYLTYLPDLNRLFGPGGLLSRDAMVQIRGDIPIFSIFDYAKSSSSLWILYWCGAAALFAMLIGLFTRVTAVLALVAVLSLIHRGPLLAARPVDEILAMLMFYLCLGPCGRTLSLDAWFQGRRSGSHDAATPRSLPSSLASSGATISTRLMQIHVTAIYVAMALAKLRGGAWWDGSAVWDLLAKPNWPLIQVAGPPGNAAWLLINAWTLAIVVFELCFAVLIWNRLARPLLLGISLAMWLGTAILTGMVSFAFMMLVANLAFVPASTFRRRDFIPPGK
jgi:hypothetical protein